MTTVHRAHERFVGSGGAPEGVPRNIAESWRRCRAAGLDADRTTAPIQLSDDTLRDHRGAHPLAPVIPVVRSLLGPLTTGTRHLIAVGDRDGMLLWVDGQPQARRNAERINFVEGASWDERHAGTNAPGTALATGVPAQVVAAEHFSRIVHPWTCSAAPVHDPVSGDLLGVIDITGDDDLATPACLALVHATARAAEGEIARRQLTRARTADRPVGGAENRLEVMGRSEGILTLDGRRHTLSRRHSEILTLLVERPEGRAGEQLGLDLYGDDANPVTLRAEMVRLRRLLGPELLGSRPYRLQMPIGADVTDIDRFLERSAVPAALRHYRGPLLPHSTAPGIERLRWSIEQDVRAAVLTTTDPRHLVWWTSTTWGRDDLEAWERLTMAAPAGATRERARSHARRLAADYGLPAAAALASGSQPRRNLARPTLVGTGATQVPSPPRCR